MPMVAPLNSGRVTRRPAPSFKYTLELMHSGKSYLVSVTKEAELVDMYVHMNAERIHGHVTRFVCSSFITQGDEVSLEYEHGTNDMWRLIDTRPTYERSDVTGPWLDMVNQFTRKVSRFLEPTAAFEWDVDWEVIS